MITRKIVLAALPAALALALGAQAQTSAPASNAATSTGTAQPQTAAPRHGESSSHATGASVSKSEVKFVEEAAAGGIAEVELGKLAGQKAQNADVKKFAERMVSDHTKANEQLKPIAAAKNIALPSGPDKKHQKEMDELARLDGEKFDREYMKHMVSDHKKDVKEFEKEAKKGKDDDVKNFASSTLPTLEEHLRLAENTNNTVKGKTH